MWTMFLNQLDCGDHLLIRILVEGRQPLLDELKVNVPHTPSLDPRGSEYKIGPHLFL